MQAKLGNKRKYHQQGHLWTRSKIIIPLYVWLPCKRVQDMGDTDSLWHTVLHGINNVNMLARLIVSDMMVYQSIIVQK